jgi:peptide deformylase
MKPVRNYVETDITRLHKVCDDVDMNNDKLVENIKSVLYSTYIKLGGKALGLSAIQCGYTYKAFLIRLDKETKEVEFIFNAKVLKTIGIRISNEGCISEGKSRYLVKRPMLAKVTYQDATGDTFTKWLGYKKARVFMHEYDHTQGVLLQDKGIKVEDYV